MVDDARVSTASTKTASTQKGLSAGMGDGRDNELLESRRIERVLQASAGLCSSSAEDRAALERIWKLIRSRNLVTESLRREARIRRVQELREKGELETEHNIELGVDGILGQRKECEDPGLGRYRVQP
jgi:hypothetical protein